jgi:hypothetical protein
MRCTAWRNRVARSAAGRLIPMILTLIDTRFRWRSDRETNARDFAIIMPGLVLSIAA